MGKHSPLVSSVALEVFRPKESLQPIGVHLKVPGDTKWRGVEGCVDMNLCTMEGLHDRMQRVVRHALLLMFALAFMHFNVFICELLLF